MHYSNKISIYTIFKGIILAIVLFATLYPFVYMISVSLSSNSYILRNEVSFYPKGFNLKMYKLVLRDPRILTAYKNTIIYVTVGTTVSLLTTCMAAYALSKKNRLLFHKLFTFMIIFTMFFGGGMIPTYLTVKGLGLFDNIWAVVLPGAINTWYLIIMRTFFQSFPLEIEESGYIDGMSDITVFWYLVLPLSKAVMATIGLFYAVNQWNAFMGPLMYLRDANKFPLQIVLRDILLLGSSFDLEVAGGGVEGNDIVISDALKYATIVVSSITIIVLYPFLQKYFVKGVMVGSLKG